MTALRQYSPVHELHNVTAYDAIQRYSETDVLIAREYNEIVGRWIRTIPEPASRARRKVNRSTIYAARRANVRRISQ